MHIRHRERVVAVHSHGHEVIQGGCRGFEVRRATGRLEDGGRLSSRGTSSFLHSHEQEKSLLQHRRATTKKELGVD